MQKTRARESLVWRHAPRYEYGATRRVMLPFKVFNERSTNVVKRELTRIHANFYVVLRDINLTRVDLNLLATGDGTWVGK